MIKDLNKVLGFGVKSHELVDNPPLQGNYLKGGVIQSISVTQKDRDRIEPVALRQIFFQDTLLFNGINKDVQMITSAGYRINYSNDNEKKKFEEFLRNLGRVGKDCTFDELYSYMYWAQFVYGAAWLELVWDTEDEQIIDLARLNPENMDYARNSSKQIVLDENQKPVGYTQKLPYGTSADGAGDEVPLEYKNFVDLGPDKIFFLPKRIVLIPLYTSGDGYTFYGTVEPAYSSTSRKLLLEEAGTNAAYQRWMAPLVAYIGDPTHPPTAQLSKTTLDQMKKMKYDMYSTYPYYTKIEPLNVNTTDALQDILKYLRENQASAIGMPLPFATSAGEATNRATLNNQQTLLEYTLNDTAKKTSSHIMNLIFKPVAESMGLDTFPKFLANRVGVDEDEDRALRYIQYVTSGILSPEEVRPVILEMEGIVGIAVPKNKPESKNKPSKEELSKIEKSVHDLAFVVPVDVRFNQDVTLLDNKTLQRYHDVLHILWGKLENGLGEFGEFKWTINQVISKHHQVTREMLKRAIPHHTPVNNLDLMSNVDVDSEPESLDF